MSSKLRKQQQAYDDWLELVERIKKQTKRVPIETKEQKAKRIKYLLAHPMEFIKYYFGHYIDSDFAWFHHKLVNTAVDNKDLFCIAELPREHAKSVFINIFIPLLLKAKGELTGMLLGSANFDKAKKLLADIQAELKGNQLYINDFGEQIGYGDWQSGYFVTSDRIGFWAFGRGQSPRGVRVGSKRPNYGSIDDIDDKVIVKNTMRVLEAVDWVTEDFLGAMNITASRLMIAGNRIHKKSILAHLVGDINTGDPKRDGVTHIKAYAIENPTTREKAGVENGVPAWSRYTMKQLIRKFKKMGHASARREFFHEHWEAGLNFKHDWIQFGKMLPIEEYDSIVTYCDPSFTNNKTSDYKAIITLGKKGKYYHVLHAWVRQASIHSMVVAFYDIYEKFKNHSTYWIEANMLQIMLLDEFDKEADDRDIAIPIRPDKTKKPDKYTRIENLTPLFERLLFLFNEELKDNPDMQMLIIQLLGFGGGGHDDGPDALEGATTKINKATRKSKFKPRMGKFKKGRRNRNR